MIIAAHTSCNASIANSGCCVQGKVTTPPPPEVIMQRARNRGGATDETNEAEATLSTAWGSTRGDTVRNVVLPELMLVGVGGMFLGYATWRYFQVQTALLQGAFPVNRVGVRVRHHTAAADCLCYSLPS